MPAGKTVPEQVTSLLENTAAYNRGQAAKEQAFLERMIKGAPEPTDASD